MKFNRKAMTVLAPVAALMLLLAAFVAAGATPRPGINVPPGAIVESPNASAGVEAVRKPVPAAPGLPTAAQPGQTDYTFDAGNLDAFRHIVDENSQTEWIINDGRLTQQYTADGGPSSQISVLATRDAQFADGSVETYFYPTAGSPLGIVLRGSDAGYYRVVLNMATPNDSEKAWVERVDGANPLSYSRMSIVPVTTYGGYALEKWQHLKVTALGDKITVVVDGKEILSLTDATFTSGWTGVWTLADRGTQFDNVRIGNAAAR